MYNNRWAWEWLFDTWWLHVHAMHREHFTHADLHLIRLFIKVTREHRVSGWLYLLRETVIYEKFTSWDKSNAQAIRPFKHATWTRMMNVGQSDFRYGSSRTFSKIDRCGEIWLVAQQMWWAVICCPYSTTDWNRLKRCADWMIVGWEAQLIGDRLSLSVFDWRIDRRSVILSRVREVLRREWEWRLWELMHSQTYIYICVYISRSAIFCGSIIISFRLNWP